MQEQRNQLGLFWKVFKPVLPSGKKVTVQKNPNSKALEQTNCISPSKPWVEHQPPSLKFPACPCCPAQRGFPTSTLAWSEEALQFLKPEHEVVSPGFFRRLLPFMLHELLEAFVWNENIWKKPVQVSPLRNS